METTTETNNEVKTQPIPDDAKKELAAALKSKTTRRTFRSVDEVVSEGIKKGEKEPSDPRAAAESAEKVETKSEPLALPEQIDIVVDDETGERREVLRAEDGSEIVKEEIKLEAKAEDEIKEKTSTKKIKIGTKSFDSEDEAIAYAEELERQALADEAFRQGIEAASQLAPSNSVSAVETKATEPEIIPDIYYTDPAKYLKQRDEQLLARAKAAVKADLTEETAKTERIKATWTKFWSDYPDLATSDKTKDLVDIVYQKNFQRLSKVKTEIALKEIAGLTREWMKDLGVTILPTKTLPNTTKPVVSSGSSATVKRPVVERKPLRWTDELKNMKSKKAEARQRR